VRPLRGSMAHRFRYVERFLPWFEIGGYSSDAKADRHDRFGSFASILPCPLSRPLSTTPDITTSDRDPSACRLPAPDLRTRGTAAAAPASWLRSHHGVELLRTLIAASRAKMAAFGANRVFRSGAPGGIRTPAPQIRGLVSIQPITVVTTGSAHERPRASAGMAVPRFSALSLVPPLTKAAGKGTRLSGTFREMPHCARLTARTR
jgi:hypothetical protein